MFPSALLAGLYSSSELIPARGVGGIRISSNSAFGETIHAGEAVKISGIRSGKGRGGTSLSRRSTSREDRQAQASLRARVRPRG